MRASIIFACLILSCSTNSMHAQDTIMKSMMNIEALVNLDISNNIALRSIELGGMPSLLEVSVWPIFPIGVNVDAYGSPNVEYNDCGVTGLEKNNVSRLSIYNNPTSALLNIEIANPEPHSIQITSLNGQAIYSPKMEENSMQIDLSSLLKEVYLITIVQ